MTKITMHSTQQGSPDGIAVVTYEAGKTYEVPDRLTHAFLMANLAVPGVENKPDVEPADVTPIPVPADEPAADDKPKGKKKKDEGDEDAE